MPQTCTICRHPAHGAIHAALTLGTPYRTIADQYEVSKSALIRHTHHGGVLAAAHHDRTLLVSLLEEAITHQHRECVIGRALMVREGQHAELAAELHQLTARLTRLRAERARWQG